MVQHTGLGMETTFYDELVPINGPVESLKRTHLTLDLMRGGKRANNGPPVLSSPDLHKLGLGTPDLEKLILQGNMITTATPTPGAPVLFPAATPTEEQESYARPFEEALHKLRNGEPASVRRPVYADLDRQVHYPMSVIKDEPQTVPSAASSPPLSPIDMDSQEKIKLERKRQRNRVAASKCRRRKLERISKLEDKVKILKGENAELNVMVVKLRDHVHRLKQQVLEHTSSGCHVDTQF